MPSNTFSYRSTQSWSTNQDPSSNFVCHSMSEMTKMAAMDEGGQASFGPSTAFLVTCSEYDPDTKTVSRETVTAARINSIAPSGPDLVTTEAHREALEIANEMDEVLWKRLQATATSQKEVEGEGEGEGEGEEEGWLATCFKEESTRALEHAQQGLFDELMNSSYPSVLLMKVNRQGMDSVLRLTLER
ncbi:hypothetical protein IAR50_004842 [Cryptococcus sp. DSM 104548]